MLDILGEANTVALIGLMGGIVLGLAARIGRFCTLGAIEDLFYAQSAFRLRLWGVAIGVAVTGTFGLAHWGWLDLPQTIYLSTGFAPFAAIAGGLIFGYGMAIAGNCGYGALARLGGGDLRNFVIVVVMGIVALATVSGVFAMARVTAFPQGDVGRELPGIAHMIAARTGLSVPIVGTSIGAIVLFASILPPVMRQHPVELFWAVMVGVAIVLAWAGTQWVASTGFEGLPVVSHTFSAPPGDMIFWLMTASAQPLSFGIGSVGGVLLGAAIGSFFKGHFRWEACDDPRELKRQIGGATLMGVGAVIATGCSVGQGLSAMSVLALSAPLTLAAIFAGAALGLRHLIAGFQPE